MTDISITWKLSHAQMETCKAVALVLGPDAADKMAEHFVSTQESLVATLEADERPRGFSQSIRCDHQLSAADLAAIKVMAERPAVRWPTF